MRRGAASTTATVADLDDATLADLRAVDRFENVAGKALWFLAGMLVMFALVALAFTQRTFLFAQCARNERACTDGDYVNDPGLAKQLNGALRDADLFSAQTVGARTRMFFARPRKTSTCRGNDTALRYVAYPQQCAFTRAADGSTVNGVAQGGFRGLYRLDDGTYTSTDTDCAPLDDAFSAGRPLLAWAI